jgi:DNA-binding MarR family transcriptional regulator
MGRAVAPRMDCVPFCVKRTHLSYTAHANRRVREWNLTAARMDLLVCYRTVLLHHGVVYQSSLRARLGVSRATICVMLQRMERRGLIERHRSESDRRLIVVTVTPAGYAAFEKARYLVDEGVYREIIDGNLLLVEFKVPLPEKRARFLLYLDTIRGQFGDLTDPPYPREPLDKLNPDAKRKQADKDAEDAAMALLMKYINAA